jgi:hypothetical protein
VTVAFDRMTVAVDWVTVAFDRMTVAVDWVTVAFDWVTVAFDWMTDAFDWVTVAFDWVTVAFPVCSGVLPISNVLYRFHVPLVCVDGSNLSCDGEVVWAS